MNGVFLGGLLVGTRWKMGRKCSHCGNNGHNSRTCNTGSSGGGGGSSGVVRLFGVQLQMASSSAPQIMKKSFSMDCLGSSSSSYHHVSSTSSPSSSSSSSLVSIEEATDHHKLIPNGYLSDGLMARTQERKKGVPWTEEEHRTFLAGLEKLGKGDWRGISRNFVTTRTPTQVASHAQKYFLRQTNPNKKKRRSSLFDVVKSSDNELIITDDHMHLPNSSPTPKLIKDRFTLSLAPSSSSSSVGQQQHPDLELTIRVT
ncbi:hypothetical protein J5N97_012927 [Dioscorea zingiberensis]|uniref:Uncharacterized protein n=1 Tax=Dioscorea zingiberensis TaxID=325984 RepID=A0A9D5CSJ7_9LILI|nr:hypothetical protein J5N97_012927 [Dioscorea zingiberensis]